MTDLVQSIRAAETCDELVTHYEDLVAGVVAGVDEADFEEVAAAFWFDPESSDLRVIAFLDEDARANLEGMAVVVAEWAGVVAVDAIDREEALEEFRELFADQPSLIEVVEEDPTTLPVSVRLTVESDALEGIVERLETYPGVRQVESTNLDQLANAVAILAVGLTGRTAVVVAIQSAGEDLGCPLEDIAQQADLSGVDAGGWVREMILDSAVRGLG